MTTYLVLGSVALLLALLIHGRIPPAILFVTATIGYLLSGLLSQDALLRSFANPALATLVLLLLVSVALERSNLLDRVTARLLAGGPTVGTYKFTAVAATLSAFLANTAVVGVLLGVVTRQKQVPPSRLLLPLSYAAILGGVTTLVGTSTNLTVSSLAVNAGLPPLGMFQLAWAGIPAAVLCIAALAVLARGLPVRDPKSPRAAVRGYFLEARLEGASPLVGRSIETNGLRSLEGLYLLEILRDGRLISPVGPEEILHAEDILIFTGEVERVRALQAFPGLRVFSDDADGLLGSNLVEVVISSQSELDKRTLRDVDFRTMFDAGVVGIRRGDERLTGQLGRIPLSVGDSLLLAVGPDFHHRHNLDRNFHLLGDAPLRPRLSDTQSFLVLGGFALVVVLAALNWLPLFNGLILMLCGLLGTRLLTLADLRRRFPFELFMLIGSSLAMAQVLDNSGGADMLARGIGTLMDGTGVWGTFVGIYLLTVVLTELISNNAAAALAFPIALSSARLLDADPTPFILAVTYGASAGFLIPFGYQTHLMVYSAGRYRLGDFVRMGLPISILFGLVIVVLVPWFFPFNARVP